MIVSDVNDGNDEPLIEPKNPGEERTEDAGEERRDREHEDARDVRGRALGVERERRIGERA